MSVGVSERPMPAPDPVQPIEWQRTIDMSIAVRGGRYIDVVIRRMEAGTASGTIMHSVMDTAERETRKRLIALGWTPPEGAGPGVDTELIKHYCEQAMLTEHTCPAVHACDAIMKEVENKGR